VLSINSVINCVNFRSFSFTTLFLAQSEMVRKLKAGAAGLKFAGRLKQIFPPRERTALDKYIRLLETACSLYESNLETLEQKQEIQKFLVRKVYIRPSISYMTVCQ